jgi:O-antigen/teichoic acid export membrane protein
VSFKRNVLASYVSQIYVAGVGLLLMPLYLRYLGAEAYGLVGFFTMMQAWIQLLDLGLSPTLAREVARFRGGSCSAAQLRLLVRSMEVFFVATAALAALAIVAMSGSIASSWLQPRALTVSEVQEALVLMALAVPLRWISGLYRGAINGFERQAFLAAVNAVIATLRFIGVVAILHFVSATPRAFFAYQLFIAVIEVLFLCITVHVLLPRVDKTEPLARWRDISGALRFSIGVSLTGAIWIVLTQADKLLLSKLLTLSDYGYVALAVAVAGGVNVVTTPLSQALMPRLARLTAESDEAGVIRLYRQSTRVIALVVGSVGGVIAFCAEPILFAWTGDRLAAVNAGAPLRWYALGNACLALAAFPYYLQFAKGQLRLHIIGNVVLVVLMLPGVWWATRIYGMSGGGMAWFIALVGYLMFWVSYSHRLLVPDMAMRWFTRDVLPFALPPALISAVVSYFMDVSNQDRLGAALVPGVCVALVLVFSVWRYPHVSRVDHGQPS